MDGGDSFPDKDVARGQHRDKFACAGIQSEESDANLRNKTPDGGNDGVASRLILPNRATFPESRVKFDVKIANTTVSAAQNFCFHTASVEIRQVAFPLKVALKSSSEV